MKRRDFLKASVALPICSSLIGQKRNDSCETKLIDFHCVETKGKAEAHAFRNMRLIISNSKGGVS